MGCRLLLLSSFLCDLGGWLRCLLRFLFRGELLLDLEGDSISASATLLQASRLGWLRNFAAGVIAQEMLNLASVRMNY